MVKLLSTRVHHKEGLVSVVEGEVEVEGIAPQEERDAVLQWASSRLWEFCPKPVQDLLVVPFVELRQAGASRWQFAIHYQFLPTIELPDYRRIAHEVNELWRSSFLRPVEEVARSVEEQVASRFRWLWEQEEKTATGDGSLQKYAQQTLGAHSFEELRAKLQPIALQEAQMEMEEAYERALGQALLDASPVEAPQMLVEYETDLLLRSLLVHLPLMRVLPHFAGVPSLQNIADLSPEELEEQIRKEAQWRVSLRLLLSRIAAEEGISVDEADVRAFAASLWSEQPTHLNWEALKQLLKDALLTARTIAFLKTC